MGKRDPLFHFVTRIGMQRAEFEGGRKEGETCLNFMCRVPGVPGGLHLDFPLGLLA